LYQTSRLRQVAFSRMEAPVPLHLDHVAGGGEEEADSDAVGRIPDLLT